MTRDDIPHDEDHHPHKRGGIVMRLRNYFLTGLVVAAPIGITAFLTWSFVTWVDDRVKPLIPLRYSPETYLPFTIPGLGVLIAVLFLILLGALTANLVGRTIVNYGEMMLDRMPLVRSIYKTLKQIFETVLSQTGNSFKTVGLMEFPRRGSWCLVFISTDAKGEVLEKVGEGEDMYTCFMPTVPNPTTGFLMFVPKKDVRILDMSVEEAAKLAISGGLVVPDYGQPPEGAAEAAKPGATKRRNGKPVDKPSDKPDDSRDAAE